MSVSRHAAQSVREDDVRTLSPAVDELALVQRVRAGEAAAFEVLFNRYYEPLCVFASGLMRSSQMAEDLVHDVLLQVWQGRAQWDVRDDVRSYLYRAIRNRALNVIKRGHVADHWRKAAAVDASAAGTGQMPVHADAAVRAHELRAAFHRALAALPERQRQAFLLRWQHELSYAEIAVVMGVSEKTVESTLTRTLKKLRKALDVFF